MQTTTRFALTAVTATALIVPLALAATAGVGTTSPAASHALRCAQPGPYDLPHGSERVDLEPAEFTARIDNPYWPMRVGTHWVYAETDSSGGRQRVDVTVTDRTKMIRGIKARVVHDVVTEGGEIVENTFDWYAQDSGGSIWYLGEFTREYEDGEPVTTEGSFEYGVDGAQAGVVVPAEPVAGCGFRQEYYKGEAEDRARILTTRDDIKVEGTKYRTVMSTSDRVPTEPFVLEHKFYGEGVGPVLVAGISPSDAREVLLRVTGPGH